MDQEPLRRLLRSLRQAAGPDDSPADGDAQLLRRFVRCGDANAFELLVWRHGPMVLGVCRRLLPNPHDAEDAFQATFLALVRKASSITAGAALGAWLYRVACRAALRLRAALARRARREQAGVDELAAPAGAAPADDLRRVLDEEVNRLPARHRAAFVLCCLEGKTAAEAARELGCPAGTVSSRLTRARARLRHRLARRGLAPAAGAAIALTSEALGEQVGAVLVRSTLEAARLLAAGNAAGGALSEQALTVAEGVVRAMSLTRLKIVTVLFLVAGLVVAGVALTRPAATAAPAGEARQDDPAGQPKPKAQQKDPPDGQKPKAEQRFVVQVVKPQTGSLERLLTQPGTVQPFSREDLYAAVPGVLKARLVDIGDRVQKGQLLAVMDAPLLALEEKQAGIALRQARGQLRESEARVATAKAEAQLARGGVALKEAELDGGRASLVFHQADFDRVKALRGQGTVTQSAIDERAAKVEAARAVVAVSRAAVENSKADQVIKETKVAQADAALETTRANVETAEIALDKARYTHGLTRVVSAVDGVITQRNYDVGAHVRPGEPGGRLPLLTVMRTDLVRVVGAVAESDIRFVTPGTPVEVTAESAPDVRLRCQVSRIGFAVDEQTRQMRIEIDVPNPKQQLRPGVSARAWLRLKVKDLAPGAVKVPQTAVIEIPGRDGTEDGAGEAVYVVRDGKADLRRVRVGTREGGQVEILAGLAPTDLVVFDAEWLRRQNSRRAGSIPVEVQKGGDPE